MLSKTKPMPCAWLNLRHSVPERQAAFTEGLTRAGYHVRNGFPGRIGARDIFITWNRIGEGHTWAVRFELEGRPVLVTENAAWGNDFAGGRWYAIAPNSHNLLPPGRIEVDRSRFDSLGVALPAFRKGGEVVILPQRGIGPPGVAMPVYWAQSAQKRHGGRIRPHPGRDVSLSKPLADDLAEAGRVITWASGAAVKALLMGIAVTSELPNWIAHQDNTAASRLAMLRRLAMYQWRLDEIASGEPFARMLR